MTTTPPVPAHTRRQLANHIGRGLATVQPRPRLTQTMLDQLRHTLTARDWWVLEALAEHRVLTTRQIARLAFDTESAARHRLHTLYRLRGLDRFRPLALAGSAPCHYVLDKGGAILLAHRRDTALTQIPYRPDDAINLAFSRQLAHTMAVNEFFVALAAAARGDPHTDLLVWWPEKRCTHTWGDIVRPDGYGLWRDHDTQTGFFAEIDLGTEPLDTLVRKVDAYTRLARTTGITTPVLFALPGPRREYGLHQALPHPEIPVATTTQRLPEGPAGASWLPVNGTGTRVPLGQLTLARSR